MLVFICLINCLFKASLFKNKHTLTKNLRIHYKTIWLLFHIFIIIATCVIRIYIYKHVMVLQSELEASQDDFKCQRYECESSRFRLVLGSLVFCPNLTRPRPGLVLPGWRITKNWTEPTSTGSVQFWSVFYGWKTGLNQSQSQLIEDRSHSY